MFYFAPMNLSYWLGSLIYPKYTWRREARDNRVYLTFDDGPHPEITPWVLDQLRIFNAKATFFIVGENAQKFPDIIKQVLDEGHAIGNHTQHHVKGWKMTSSEYIKDIRLCEEQIPTTGLFRPPYGQMNKMAGKELNEYEIIMWDILSKDYLKGLNLGLSLWRMKYYTKSGSIIVFHDSTKANDNLRFLLPRYLEFMAENGFQSVVL